jgi:hypothetical protein
MRINLYFCILVKSMNTISQNTEQYKLFNVYTSNTYQAENNLLGGVNAIGKSGEIGKNEVDKKNENPTQLGKDNKQITDKFTLSSGYQAQKEDESEPKFGQIRNKSKESDKTTKSDNKSETKQNGELTEEEQKVVQKLKERDREVKAHEQAHLAAAGGLAKGGASYTYQVGPDGGQYAVGGEVQIELSGGSTPQETIAKMQQVRRAALAPAEPSSQDISVANAATKIEAEARAQLREQQTEAAKPKEKQEEKSSLEHKSDSKFDFSKLLNNKYGITNKSESKDINTSNSNSNEYSSKNNIKTKIESFA